MPLSKRKPRKDDDDQVIKVNPTVNAIFTSVFLAQVVCTFAALFFSKGVVTCPVDGQTACALLLASCIGCFACITVVKGVSGAVGAFLSRTVFPGDDPLATKKTRHKYEDQMWQLAIHASMSAFEAYILFFEEGTVDFWKDYTQFWTPHPRSNQMSKDSIHVLYLLQMAIWIVTCFQHRFVEERHKDYFMMYAHHVVTIALVALSYFNNYMRIGVVVLFIHDLSDIPVDLLKIFNYCQLEGPKGLFLVEIIFVTNLVGWAYLRFYLYFTKVIWYGVLYGAREIASSPTETCFHDWNLAHGGSREGPYTRGHPKTWKPGDGSFSLIENIRAVPYHAACLPYYWESAALLLALQLMHIIWYFMFLRILYRMINESSDSLHDAGREVYEGDSGDEGEGGPSAAAAKKKRN